MGSPFLWKITNSIFRYAGQVSMLYLEVADFYQGSEVY